MSEEAEVIENDIGATIDEGTEPEVDVVEEETTEAAEETTEEAAPEPPKVEFSPEQQEVFNREISKKVASRAEEKRRADDLQRQLEEAQKQLNPAPQRPVVPPMPDPYAHNYEQQMQARDKAINEAAAYDSRQAVISEISLVHQQNAQREQQRAAEEAITSYVDRGVNLGHKKEEVVAATEYLMNVGLSVDAQQLIRDDKDGPDMAMFLAKNPDALNEMLEKQAASPVFAIAHLASSVKQQASGSFRQGKLPPDPVDHLKGRGAAEGGGGPKGATYE